MATGDDVRRIALALPEVEERETWGEATFRVREKIFVMLSGEPGHASIKASLEAQQALVASQPETFRIAAYTGRYGWVTVNLATVDADELRELVCEAWRRTAPKRLAAALDAQEKR
jgi:hypothetical protein